MRGKGEEWGKWEMGEGGKEKDERRKGDKKKGGNYRKIKKGNKLIQEMKKKQTEKRRLEGKINVAQKGKREEDKENECKKK